MTSSNHIKCAFLILLPGGHEDVEAAKACWVIAGAAPRRVAIAWPATPDSDPAIALIPRTTDLAIALQNRHLIRLLRLASPPEIDRDPDHQKKSEFCSQKDIFLSFTRSSLENAF